jgi:hypothetical protein
MSLVKAQDLKNGDKLTEGYGDFAYWAGNGACESPGPDEKYVIDNRDKFKFLGGITDDQASYSYDDWALLKHKGKFWLLATSGCSCPSPSETWRVEAKEVTLTQLRKKLESGDYQGYTVPGGQMSQFMELLDAVKAAQ